MDKTEVAEAEADAVLREGLSSHLCQVPPVTDSNREFLRQKLARLQEEDGVAHINWDDPDPTQKRYIQTDGRTAFRGRFFSSH